MNRRSFLFLLLSGCGGSSPPIGPGDSQPPKLLIIGDSLAVHWEEYQNKYGSLVPGWKIDILGVGGQTSGEILARYKPQGYDRVLIICGTNDVSRLGNDASIANLQQMTAITKDPITFLIPTLVNREVEAWNLKVAKLGYPTLDGYVVSKQPGTMLSDGVHFTELGYKYLTQQLQVLVS